MKDKNIIVCIVGSSGSGKTFLAQHLEKTQEIPVVISYTTRPMREGEVDGVEHWFVGPDRVKQAKKDKDILAYTKFGDHEYFASLSDVRKNEVNVYVVDEDGINYLKKNFGKEFVIIPIYVKRSVENRLKSGISQERIDRDEKRILLPEKDYAAIIENDGTIGEFVEKINNLW